VIVASFYSTARGQCIAYSNDGGLTFTDYTNNPVVNVTGRDPHMLVVRAFKLLGDGRV
jgi:fructan beta-fructosidase